MSRLMDRHVEARTMTDLAAVYARHGSLHAAIGCYERSLAALRDLGDLDAEARVMRELGAIRNRVAGQDAPARS